MEATSSRATRRVRSVSETGRACVLLRREIYIYMQDLPVAVLTDACPYNSPGSQSDPLRRRQPLIARSLLAPLRFSCRRG